MTGIRSKPFKTPNISNSVSFVCKIDRNFKQIFFLSLLSLLFLLLYDYLWNEVGEIKLDWDLKRKKKEKKGS